MSLVGEAARALAVGLGLGFAGSMPIAGPISALVVRRALEGRRAGALAVSAGASVPEGAYAFMAFWGLTTLLARHPGVLPVSRLLGALMLVGLGTYFLVHRMGEPQRAAQGSDRRGWRDALLGFSMTVANPTLIVTWSATVGIAHSTGLLPMDPRDALPFALGVTAGIVGWFAMLVLLLERYRARASVTSVRRVIRAMGVVLLCCGLALCGRALAGWLHAEERSPSRESRGPRAGAWVTAASRS